MKTKAHKAPGKFKSAILNWLGFGLTDYAQWSSLYGRDTYTGETVNTDTATQLSTVYSCTRLISQRIATLPFELYRRTADGREQARQHPLNRLLKIKPNADMVAPVFWEAVISSILLQRGAYLEKMYNGANEIMAIGFLHPLRICWDQQRGAYRYVERDGKNRWIEKELVVYIPAFTTDGIHGQSVIEYGMQAIGTAIAADKAAGTTFKNGLQPTTYFKYPTVLKPEQRDDARAAIELLSGASKAGKPIILEAGMEQGTIGVNPRDAQLLESRQMSAEEICSLFGVPPTMIGRGDKASSWASSAEQLNLWFLNYTLMPWMKRIEASVLDGFLTPTEQLEFYPEYNFEAMLRGDSAARSSFYSTALQNGWMNRNHVAQLENQPTFEGGEIYTVQSNLIPIEQLGNPDAGNALRDALNNYLGANTDDS